jgi:hypothetical protein
LFVGAQSASQLGRGRERLFTSWLSPEGQTSLNGFSIGMADYGTARAISPSQGGEAMKKIIVLLLAIPMLMACAHLRESDDVDPIVQGTWIGEGHFYDRDLKQEYGNFAVTIEIHPDNSVSGDVGGASLAGGVIKSRPNDFLIESELTGPVVDQGTLPGLKKDTVVFILKPPGDVGTEGNIHLKTNLIFDFSMRVGGLAHRKRGHS